MRHSSRFAASTLVSVILGLAAKRATAQCSSDEAVRDTVTRVATGAVIGAVAGDAGVGVFFEELRRSR